MHQAIINLHQNAYDGMASSEGQRFDSSWGLRIFPLSHTHKGNISLYDLSCLIGMREENPLFFGKIFNMNGVASLQ